MSARRKKSRFWRICRLYFRGIRMSIWVLILCTLAAIIYVNQIGLPDFAKRPLLEKLRARGLDLQFSRLRLSWNQGIVAENVHFGPAALEISPHLTVGEVQVRLNWNALAHLRLQVDSLMLRHGRLSWALLETNQAPQELSIAGIQTDLRFLPEDEWSLDNFKALFAGAKIHLSGVLTNASAVRDWKIFQAEPQQQASISAKLWQRRLRSLADHLAQVHFSEPPELRVNVRGDALDLHTFNVLLSLSAPGADTPWGEVSRGRFAAHLFSMDTNGLSRAELEVRAEDARTRWAAITNFSLNIHLASLENQTNLVNGDLQLSADQVQTRWANGSNALITATWVHSITNPIPLSGRGTIGCDYVQTSWGSARGIQLDGDFARTAEPTGPPDQSLAWWTNVQPYQIGWNCRLAEFGSPKLVASEISCAGSWLAPRLTVTNLNARVYDGQLAASGDLDAGTRAARLNFNSDFDPHRLALLLPEGAVQLLDQVSWPKSPQVEAELAMTLPAWTNSAPDWRAEVQPTLLLHGEINFAQGASYREVQASSARTHFIYSNQCWQLPDLTLTRPEGRLQAEHRTDENTKDFYWRLSSTLDPSIVRPLLDENGKKAVDLFTFTQPPAVDLEVWGRWNDADRTGLQGRVTLSNFTFRGIALTHLQTAIEYTNRIARFTKPWIQVADRHVEADALTVDLNAQLIYLTNGLSNVDPTIIAKAIGPQIVRAIEDYRFSSPPDGRVYGTIPLHGEAGADLHFDLKGGPFHWWKFNLPHITGQVHWSGLHLTLTNVQAEFYHGLAAGWAAFDFPPDRGTEFQFGVATTNVLLQALMADLSTHTNHLEGRLSGTLAVTKANSDTWQTVFGYGDAHLRDGLIWDIPVFGIFSPILNGIAPGLGNSRASAANASFIISNGVIRTSDLEIRSTGMRLQYRGTVDLQGHTNARVEAEILRDMWLVGPLVSTVFSPVAKLFEYRVTGDLADPKTEPVFILPKIMLLPFHPIRTLKGTTEDPNTSPYFSPLPP